MELVGGIVIPGTNYYVSRGVVLHYASGQSSHAVAQGRLHLEFQLLTPNRSQTASGLTRTVASLLQPFKSTGQT